MLGFLFGFDPESWATKWAGLEGEWDWADPDSRLGQRMRRQSPPIWKVYWRCCGNRCKRRTGTDAVTAKAERPWSTLGKPGSSHNLPLKSVSESGRSELYLDFS